MKAEIGTGSAERKSVSHTNNGPQEEPLIPCEVQILLFNNWRNSSVDTSLIPWYSPRFLR